MRLVIVESPLRGDFVRNQRYARLCLLHCLQRGEAPLASHLLYAHSDILDDAVPQERTLGMEAGFAWGEKADLVAVYTDLGISSGMLDGVKRAGERQISVEYRKLPEHLLARL